MATDAKTPIYPSPPRDPEALPAYLSNLIRMLRLRDTATPGAPASEDWEVTNTTELRTYDVSTDGLPELERLVVTLINDLKNAGYLG